MQTGPPRATAVPPARRECVAPSKVRSDVEVDLPAGRVDGLDRVGEIQAQHAHGRFPAKPHASTDVQDEILAEKRVAGIHEDRGAEAAPPVVLQLDGALDQPIATDDVARFIAAADLLVAEA